MQRDKLNEIVGDLNEQRERDAHHEATRIITEIARMRTQIKQIDDRIAEYQKQLHALEVEQLDPAEVLGGEA